MKNCHRAATVQQIATPENGVWAFEWRGQKVRESFMYAEYAHIATRPGADSPIIIPDCDGQMKLWAVVSWKYETNLGELWDLACRAYYNTSHDPEKRAAYHIRNFEEALNSDLKEMPEDEQERYIAKFTEWVRTLFYKHSQIASSMITGPANFPTRRNEKANNSYESAVSEFQNWREKTQKAIARRIEEAKPQEQKEFEAWERVKADIDHHFLPTNLYNRLETVARKGEVVVMEQAIAYVRELNKTRKRPIFTERHKFFKLADLARTAQQQLTAKANTKDKDEKFDGGIVRYNTAEDRLQILFDNKPDAEMIGKLKMRGFRWSPRFGAWQRQLTIPAKHAAGKILNIEL